MKKFKEGKTGIVLSGGAVRGFAHLGVLKALNEADIYPDIISGVSAGSIVGALYADGHNPEEILEIFEKEKFFNLIKFIFNNSGLLDISGLRKLMEKNLSAKKFEELKIPLVITATNIKEGSTEYFSDGSLVDKILASSSIPVIFKPTKIKGSVYVDGGLTNNLPIEPIEKKCENFIGVNVNPLEENPQLQGLKNIAVHAFHLGIAAHINGKKDKFDMYIEPQELRKFGYFNISDSRKIFDIGYKETQKVLSKS